MVPSVRRRPKAKPPKPPRKRIMLPIMRRAGASEGKVGVLPSSGKAGAAAGSRLVVAGLRLVAGSSILVVIVEDF